MMPVESLLLLDDEESVLELYLAILLQGDADTGSTTGAPPTEVLATSGPVRGVRLLVARSGEEAVALVERAKARGERISGGFFDLRLRDGLSGMATIRAVRDLDDDILVTVVTGYRGCTIDEIHEMFLPDKGDEWDYLAKPFSRWEIQQKARQMLSSWSRRRRDEGQAAEIGRLNADLELQGRALEGRVRSRTREVESANEQLAERNGQLEDVLEELSRTQASLVQHEKMAGAFGLAAAVAREVGRPVNSVSAALAELDGSLATLEAFGRRIGEIGRPRPDGDRATSDLRGELEAFRQSSDADAAIGVSRSLAARCLSATTRIARTIGALEMFALPGADLPRPQDVGEALTSAIGLIASELRPAGRIEVRLSGTSLVMASGDQLEQAWLALLTNALQAVDDAGGAGRVHVHAWTDEGDVVVEVRDDGAGIPPDLLRRVFEPFFTTRGVGGGVGLGLSLAFAIVAGHGGHLEAESEEGRGACFRARLPSAFARDPAQKRA